MSLSSEGQHLSTNQISSTYLNPQLRYNYFRFGKTTLRHIGIIFPVSISTMSPQSVCHSAPVCQISSKSERPRQENDVMSILNFRGSIMGSLISAYRTSYSSSIETIALSCLVFKKNFYVRILATERQTDGQTGQAQRIKPLWVSPATAQ